MTSRRLKTGGRAWTQVWDGENRLRSVAYEGVTQTITITFTYDGQGSLVDRETPTDTTVLVGGIYEKNLDTGEVTKYYFFGGQRVAMKKGSTLCYLFGDHLGTTSLAVTSTGTAIVVEASLLGHRPPRGELTNDRQVYLSNQFPGSPSLPGNAP